MDDLEEPGNEDKNIETGSILLSANCEYMIKSV